MANTATVEIIVSARDQTTTAFRAIGTQLKSIEKQARAMGSALGMITTPVRALGGVLSTLADIAGTAVRGAFAALKTAVGWVRDQIDNLIEGCKRATMVLGGLAAAGTAVISKITMYAARTEELGVALAQVARVTGHSTAEIQAQEEAIEALGITTQAARTLLMRMFAAELDVADATKIARAAQDLAVIGMRDSSEATHDLIYAVVSLQPRLMKKYGIYVNLIELYREAAKELNVEVMETYDHADAIAKLNLTLRENILKRKQLVEKVAIAITATHDHADAIRKLNLTLKENIVRQKELAAEIAKTLTTTHDHTDAIRTLDLTLKENILRREQLYNKITEGTTATHDHTDAIRKLNLRLRENIVRQKQLAEKIVNTRQEEDYSALALERLEIDYQQLTLTIKENQDELAKLTKEHGQSITSTEELALALRRQQIDYRQLGVVIEKNRDELVKLEKEHGQTVFSTEDLTLALERQQIDYEQLGLVIEENRDKLVKLTREHGQTIASTEGLNFSLERMEIDYQQLGLAIEGNRDQLEKLGGEHGQAIASTEDLEVALTGVQKRQLMLNAILEQAAAYTGTYEAAMTTAGKQIRSFPRYLAALKEAFGEFFLPILAEGVRVATEFVKSLIALPAATKELISRFLLAATAAAGVIAGLAGLVVLMSKLAPLIKFLLNPFGLFITVLGILAARWLSTGDVLVKVSNLVQTVIIPAFMALKAKVVDFANKVIEKMRPAILWIQDWLYQLQVRLQHALSTGNWDPFLRLLSTVVREAWNKLRPLRDMLAGIVTDFITRAKDWLVGTGLPILEKALGGIKDLIINTIWPNYVEPALNWLIERVGAWVEGTGFPFLQRAFGSLWAWIKDSLWPWLKDTAWPWIKEKLLWLMGEMEKWVETTGGPLLVQLAKNLWGAFWRSAAESFEVPEWMEEIKEQIDRWFMEAREGAAIWQFPGAPPLPPVSLQHGGIVPGRLGTPQLIMAHAGERVIPVGKASSPASPAFRRLVIEIPIYLDGREIARVVDDRLADRLRAEGITL